MLKIIELAVVWYDVKDMARARAFYEGVLNLTPTTAADHEYGQWVEYEFGPYALSLWRGPEPRPGPGGATAALEMEDFDAAIAHLKSHNVTFQMEPFETPVCHMAMIADPEGNTICIHKRKAK